MITRINRIIIIAAVAGALFGLSIFGIQIWFENHPKFPPPDSPTDSLSALAELSFPMGLAPGISRDDVIGLLTPYGFLTHHGNEPGFENDYFYEMYWPYGPIILQSMFAYYEQKSLDILLITSTYTDDKDIQLARLILLRDFIIQNLKQECTYDASSEWPYRINLNDDDICSLSRDNIILNISSYYSSIFGYTIHLRFRRLRTN